MSDFDASSLTAEPLAVLLKHNAWATRELLVICRGLSEEQFHQCFEIGLGSLHDTLTHIIGAMFRWADRIGVSGQAIRPSIEQSARPSLPDGPTTTGEGMPQRTPMMLLDLLMQADAELTAVASRARDQGLSSIIEVRFADKVYHFTRGAALVHVATHGMHHRAQCLNMLRRLNVPGVSDCLPDLDPLEWQARIETHEISSPEV